MNFQTHHADQLLGSTETRGTETENMKENSTTQVGCICVLWQRKIQSGFEVLRK